MLLPPPPPPQALKTSKANGELKNAIFLRSNATKFFIAKDSYQFDTRLAQYDFVQTLISPEIFIFSD